MDIADIPQDESDTYAGHVKVMYAVKDGSYLTKVSNGWNDEEFVTQQAVQALKSATEAAAIDVHSGLKSPLFYYMHAYRYDLASLAKSTGLFKWQVTRHFDSKIFGTLPNKTLQRYADAFNLSIHDLVVIPKL